jgi:hypothetical protein
MGPFFGKNSYEGKKLLKKDKISDKVSQAKGGNI